MEWQQQGDFWFLGHKIRGLIREFAARVWFEAGRWRWETSTPDLSGSGEALTFQRAVELAEKTLGMTDA